VTDRRAPEEQLRQAQKMEAVGRLAGGVAHDFNNVLAVVLGYSELLVRELEEGDRKAEHLSEIQRAAERAASLTRQLLAFSRKQVLSPTVLDLNAVLLGVERMLRPLTGEQIEVRLVRHVGLWLVNADPGQLEQVVLNLALNARDAMPHGGSLVLETSNADVGAADAASLGIDPGRYVKLTVKDTGVGMAADVKENVFEPFFTTKELGKGTGLGLATVYGVVRQSGGHVRVESEVGLGSTFEVYLPCVEGLAEETVPAPRRAGGGSETILLVEDEDSLRQMVRSLLVADGYTVVDAASGAEALEIARQKERSIDLLLTDVVMPKITGPQLATRVRAARPGIKVLFMSGYSLDVVGDHGAFAEGALLLAKPFTAETLQRKVAEALASAVPS
jgi:CheY-like chemotaxis protein